MKLLALFVSYVFDPAAAPVFVVVVSVLLVVDPDFVVPPVPVDVEPVVPPELVDVELVVPPVLVDVEPVVPPVLVDVEPVVFPVLVDVELDVVPRVVPVVDPEEAGILVLTVELDDLVVTLWYELVEELFVPDAAELVVFVVPVLLSWAGPPFLYRFQ